MALQGVRTTRGCMGCRRRKKACDFAKPTCDRCRRLNITCRYEERQYIFVSEGGSLEISSTEDRHASSTVGPASLTGSLQNSLLLSEVELQADAGFWSIYAPQDSPTISSGAVGDRSTSWIATVRALAESDPHLRTAVRALAFTGLGWMRNEPPLVQHGLHLYARALRATNTLLRDPVAMQSDNVLACCRVLSVYEMFRRTATAPSTGDNQVIDWQRQIDGVCRLVQLRGPERHISGHGRSLFDATRYTAVIYGIASRQSNRFISSAWVLPREKSLRDELFDIVSMVSGLY